MTHFCNYAQFNLSAIPHPVSSPHMPGHVFDSEDDARVVIYADSPEVLEAWATALRQAAHMMRAKARRDAPVREAAE